MTVAMNYTPGKSGMDPRRLEASLTRTLQGGSSFRRRFAAGTERMDMTWVTGRIAVGGGIWHAENMAKVAAAGVTHIIDMQIEFDDTSLGKQAGVVVLWNPTDDDFTPKPPDLFERGVKFARNALDEEGTKLFIHCAAGIHRAPMMALAVLGSLGWTVKAGMELIEAKRPVVDFVGVYVESVKRYLEKN